MTKKYVHVRMRKDDYDKIIREKKPLIEEDLKFIFGKPIKMKTIQLFGLAANSNWELQNYWKFQLKEMMNGHKRRKPNEF